MLADSLLQSSGNEALPPARLRTERPRGILGHWRKSAVGRFGRHVPAHGGGRRAALPNQPDPSQTDGRGRQRLQPDSTLAGFDLSRHSQRLLNRQGLAGSRTTALKRAATTSRRSIWKLSTEGSDRGWVTVLHRSGSAWRPGHSLRTCGHALWTILTHRSAVCRSEHDFTPPAHFFRCRSPGVPVCANNAPPTSGSWPPRRCSIPPLSRSALRRGLHLHGSQGNGTETIRYRPATNDVGG